MHTVTLVTRPDCGQCDRAKALLDRLAAELSLAVVVVDLTSPEGQRLAVESGMAFPPAVLVDGQPFSYGRLSERKLRRVLTNGTP